MGDRETLGEFEHHVLLATLRLGEGAFTAPIVEELERNTDRSVAPAAVYIALRRLEKKGLIRSDKRLDRSSGPTRQRRFVTLTPEGVKVLRAARADLERLWSGMDRELETDGAGG
jgi:DNA-binding PadR family transcriptional regulator